MSGVTNERTQAVNEYGAMARDHCRRWLPPAYAEITDPESYFTDLGDRVAQEISDLWAEMRAQAGNPRGEDYIARVGRLNALRKQAEEIVTPSSSCSRPNPVPAAMTLTHDGPVTAPARFRPQGQDDLAPSGTASRVGANLAALRTLRLLQA